MGPNTCHCFEGWNGTSCREGLCIVNYYINILHVDINECMDSNICDQYCNNTEGSYYCDCKSGYYLLNDNKTCEGKHINLLLKFYSYQL